MMLAKGVYGHEFDTKRGPFALRCGQYRFNEICHNAGWYNANGEKLGFGDLSDDDFKRIAENIPDGEAFIVLGERDSFWNFVDKPGIIGALCRTKPEHDAPGIKYVISCAKYIITKNRCCYAGDSIAPTSSKVQFETITPKQVKEIVKNLPLRRET